MKGWTAACRKRFVHRQLLAALCNAARRSTTKIVFAGTALSHRLPICLPNVLSFRSEFPTDIQKRIYEPFC